MRFLKRHFEKIVLSAVLAGLAAVACWLYVAVKEVKEEPPIDYRQPASAKALTNLDLAPLRAALANMTNAPAFELGGEHNLFNPVLWKMKRNGDLIKMTRQGAAVLAVTEIRPLYFTISLDTQVGNDGFYMIAKHALARQSQMVCGDWGSRVLPEALSDCFRHQHHTRGPGHAGAAGAGARGGRNGFGDGQAAFQKGGRIRGGFKI